MKDLLRWLNELAPQEAESEFLKCCGSSRWAREMTAARPFSETRELKESADRIWHSLAPDDWLEAFRAHPQIGERKAARATGAEAARWSEEEQSGTRDAAQETMAALAEANRAYEQKFGHIFIICATGKTSVEMLAAARARLANDPETELRVAAEEQRRITQLRLEKLLNR